MAIFSKITKSYIGWIRKIPGIHATYHFCDLSSKNGKFRFKTKILKFHGIQPYHGQVIRGMGLVFLGRPNRDEEGMRKTSPYPWIPDLDHDISIQMDYG